jgi:DNA adenine methylase
MARRIIIPPIKCQGIKSKLVPWIKAHIDWSGEGRWIEPFLGSGVVGFNARPKHALFCDNNPHIIEFYREVNAGNITPPVVRQFLEKEGRLLSENGKDYYYEVRRRFNREHADYPSPRPLDFLFLNRSCFNGVIRFNSRGKFNVPFNHKPERFSKAYITKVVNQVRSVCKLCQLSEWEFVCQDFRKTLSQVEETDFVYCDPPYIGRHTDYFNTWSPEQESELFDLLSRCPGRFILSTWHSNQYRQNPYIDRFWANFHIVTKDHFYHVGAKETNRNPMLEALVMNYQPQIEEKPEIENYLQLQLLETRAAYDAERQ